MGETGLRPSPRSSVWFSVFLAFTALKPGWTGERIAVGEFSLGRLAGWKTREFHGRTSYSLVERAGVLMLRAESRGTASGLVREISVDLGKTPYLHWSWCIDNTLGQLDERSRSGDDYPARIYVIASGGLAFWRTRSLNYVWASNARPGEDWPNAFAGKNVQMLALRSGNPGQCYRERRNVRADLARYFAEEIRHIDALALMTDTDNSGRHTVAYYGDLWFSSE
jgi:hypothetical protein